MKKVGKSIFCLGIGTVLLAGTVLTGQYGLPKEDKEIYEMACAQQEYVDELGFRDFRLTDYPLAYYDGNYDYVLTWEGDTIRIDRRKPVLNTFAGTAYPVGDHYEIIVPTLENFRGLFDTLNMAGQLGGLSGGDRSSFEESAYGEKEQVATIWHEAFHAWQSTFEEETIEALLAGHTFEEEEFGEQMIVQEVDSRPEIRAIYEQELALLKQAVELAADSQEAPEREGKTEAPGISEAEVDTLQSIILQYRQLEEKRMGMLPEEVLILEEYYRRLEGSAYYVEGYIYQKLYSWEAFEKQYLEGLDVYTGGSNKYYGIGMAYCRILDRIAPDWKAGYDFSESLTDLIYEALGI